MGFQLSPGVVTSEIDLTTVVPAVASSTGAFAGTFQWGPIEQAISIADETQLVQMFGKPDSNTAMSFFTCANFLAYGNDLRVVRASSATTNTAKANVVSESGNVVIKNEQDYYNNYHSVNTASIGAWASRYPGGMGNTLRVDVWANNDSVAFSSWTWASLFNSVPGTSVYANNISAGCNDEMHIVVVDEDGLISGVKNNPIESFAYVSKASDAKDDTGSSNYFREVIYKKSKYIYSTDLPNTETTAVTTGKWGTTLATANTIGGGQFTQIDANSTALYLGTDGIPVDANVITAFGKFSNSEEIDISLVMTGAHSATVQQYAIDYLGEGRKDCVVFVSPPLSATQSPTGPADAIAGYRNSTAPYAGSGIGRSTSYAVMDSAWKYQYDKYNDTYRWVPANGDMAGLCVRTDATRDPWFSPAGLTRGTIKNVVKLSFNPNKTERDTLYKNGVNPIVSFPGEGTILFGDKTLLAKPSAFDRINVRRLFVVLEKAIARAARSSLFEFNDEFTRAQFVSLVEPFLRDVQGRRGIYDFRVVCDTTNNTGEVIDRNEFRGDIYIKPARSINFIQLNFVAVRTGVSFDEVVGKF